MSTDDSLSILLFLDTIAISVLELCRVIVVNFNNKCKFKEGLNVLIAHSSESILKFSSTFLIDVTTSFIYSSVN